MFKKKSSQSTYNAQASGKKPIYKRKWFIALIVLLILGAIGSNSGDSTTSGGGKSSSEQFVILDATVYKGLSESELVELLGDPESIEDEVIYGPIETPCKFYNYGDMENAHSVSFTVADGKVLDVFGYIDTDQGISIDKSKPWTMLGFPSSAKSISYDSGDDYVFYNLDVVDKVQFLASEGNIYFFDACYYNFYFEEWYNRKSPRVELISARTQYVESQVNYPKTLKFSTAAETSNPFYARITGTGSAENAFGVRGDFTYTVVVDNATNATVYCDIDGGVLFNSMEDYRTLFKDYWVEKYQK